MYRLNKGATAWAAAMFAVVLCSNAQAVLYAPFGPGGSLNAYMYFDDNNGALDPDFGNLFPIGAQNRTWDQARLHALLQTYAVNGGVFQGHLVTMGSQEEVEFAANIGGSGITPLNVAGGSDRWIGLTDATVASTLDGFDATSLGAVEGGNTAGQPLPTPGSVPVSGERGFGWVWIDGTPFAFQAWGGGEPNNSGGEDAAHIRGDGLWNDQKAGATIGETNNTGKRAIVEFETALPFSDGIAPAFKATIVKVQDVQIPGATVGNLTQAREVVAGTRDFGGAPQLLEPTFGTGGVANAQLTLLNIAEFAGDQEGVFRNTGNAAQQRLGFPDAGPPGFGGGAQDNYVMLATGSFMAGSDTFTMGVNSDDGFELIIRDTGGGIIPFTAFFGDNGTLIGNGTSGTTNGSLAFTAGRGAFANGADTNPDNQPSYGQISLTSGETYSFELINWEGGGGASLEAFYMIGAFPDTTGTGTAFMNNNFVLFGDDSQGLVNWTPIDVTTFKLFNQVNYNDVNNLGEADDALAGTLSNGPLASGFPKMAFYSHININDADNNNAGNFLTGEDPVFGVRGQDDFVLQAVGVIQVEQAGQYTFNVFTDDGARLRLDLNGDGVFDDLDNLIANNGTTNLLAVVDLPTGFIPVEFTWFERGGGAHAELSAAFGAFSAFDAQVFRLVGDVENGGLAVFSEDPSVPEPATGLLALLGAGALGLRRRRAA